MWWSAHRAKTTEADMIITFTKPGLHCSNKNNMLVICTLIGWSVSGGKYPPQIASFHKSHRMPAGCSDADAEFSTGSVTLNAALPSHGHQWNSKGGKRLSVSCGLSNLVRACYFYPFGEFQQLNALPSKQSIILRPTLFKHS